MPEESTPQPKRTQPHPALAPLVSMLVAFVAAPIVTLAGLYALFIGVRWLQPDSPGDELSTAVALNPSAEFTAAVATCRVGPQEARKSVKDWIGRRGGGDDWWQQVDVAGGPHAILNGQYLFSWTSDDGVSLSGFYVDGQSGAVRPVPAAQPSFLSTSSNADTQ